MIYREWKYEDIYTIAELEKECFPVDNWTYRLFSDWFQSDGFYGILAEDNGEIVAYGGITVGYDDVDLENIAVIESYRGQGIAREILKRLEKKARDENKDRIFLEVRLSNSPALVLYLKNGFVCNNLRKKYYGNGEDALVLIKNLKN